MLKGSARLLSHRHIILNHNDSYEVISMEVVAGLARYFTTSSHEATREKRRRREWTSKFISFLKKNGIRCIVFDMDHTMSAVPLR